MSEWSHAEKALLKQAQRVARGEEPSADGGLPRATLALCRTVFERSHIKHPLRKSGELVPALRLLDKPLLFAEGELLRERLDFLIEVMQRSDQRPVLEAAALRLLELREHDPWDADPARKARVVEVIAGQRQVVMPAIALESELLGRSTGPERLAGLTFDNRRLRLGELVAVLAQSDDPASLETLVGHTFEATFADGGGDERKRLVERLFQELDREGHLVENHEAWRLLFEPLMLQNSKAPSVQVQIIKRLEALEGDRLTPYLSFYLQTVPAAGLDLGLVALCAKGGLPLVKLLGPLTQGRGWFGPTPLATAAQQSLDTIVAREGLDGLAGGVSLVDDSAGALSIANVREGGLSVAPEPLPVVGESNGARPTLVTAGLLGLGGLGLLLWALL